MKLIAGPIFVLSFACLLHRFIAKSVDGQQNKQIAAQYWSESTLNSAQSIAKNNTLDRINDELGRDSVESAVTHQAIYKQLTVTANSGAVESISKDVRSAVCIGEFEVKFQDVSAKLISNSSVGPSKQVLITQMSGAELLSIWKQFDAAFTKSMST